MNLLTLVRSESTPHQSEIIPGVGEEGERVLQTFDACIETVREYGLSFSTYEFSAVDSQDSVQDALDGMADNEARFIQVVTPINGGKTHPIRSILAINRSENKVEGEDGSESVFTIFTIRNEDENEQMMVFQEVKDEALGFSSQIRVNFDPRAVQPITSDRSAIANGVQVQRTKQPRIDKQTEAAFANLDKVVLQCQQASVQELVKSSRTEEMDRIKKSLRAKGRVKALFAVAAHIPEYYREERRVA